MTSTRRLVKYEAVCESGNTDADTILQAPDRETAEIFCHIWRVSRPGTNAYVRETQHRQLYNKELGLSVLTLELYY